VKNGMDAAKLSVVGYGETRPIATNATKEGRSKNRRVELVVSGVMDATATDLIEEGMIQFKNQNYREALDRFLKALQSDSRSAKAYQLAGDCYLRLGGKDQAVQAYRMALKYDPSNTGLKQWMDQYAPQAAPALPAPNTAPAGGSPSSPGANPALPALPPPAGGTTNPSGRVNPAQPSGAQPEAPTPAAAAPAAPAPAAPAGMPQPVENQ
jgi:hypothetical protein